MVIVLDKLIIFQPGGGNGNQVVVGNAVGGTPSTVVSTNGPVTTQVPSTLLHQVNSVPSTPPSNVQPPATPPSNTTPSNRFVFNDRGT